MLLIYKYDLNILPESNRLKERKNTSNYMTKINRLRKGRSRILFVVEKFNANISYDDPQMVYSLLSDSFGRSQKHVIFVFISVVGPG